MPASYSKREEREARESKPKLLASLEMSLKVLREKEVQLLARTEELGEIKFGTAAFPAAQRACRAAYKDHRHARTLVYRTIWLLAQQRAYHKALRIVTTEVTSLEKAREEIAWHMHRAEMLDR